MQKLLQVRLPLEDKRDFANDLRRRGLTQRQVTEWLIVQQLERIRAGQEPSYSILQGEKIQECCDRS